MQKTDLGPSQPDHGLRHALKRLGLHRTSMQLHGLAAGSLFLVLAPNGDVNLVSAEPRLHVEFTVIKKYVRCRDHATGSETSADLTSRLPRRLGESCE